MSVVELIFAGLMVFAAICIYLLPGICLYGGTVDDDGDITFKVIFWPFYLVVGMVDTALEIIVWFIRFGVDTVFGVINDIVETLDDIYRKNA